MTLKADLTTLRRNWRDITRDAPAPCPIEFPGDKSSEFLRLSRLQSDADEAFQACQEAVGVGSDGWVPTEHYDEAKQQEGKTKTVVLDASETEGERARMQKNSIFLTILMRKIICMPTIDKTGPNIQFRYGFHATSMGM